MNDKLKVTARVVGQLALGGVLFFLKEEAEKIRKEVEEETQRKLQARRRTRRP